MWTLNRQNWGALVIGLLAASFTATAWAARPMSYTLEPEHFEAVPFFDCAAFGYSFWILGDWTYTEFGRIHFDNQGNMTRIEGFGRVLDPRAYNSEDPNKELTREDMVGTTEHSHITVRFDDNGIATWYKESGIGFRAVVPGIGRIAIDAGTVSFVSDNGFDWFPRVITPNRETSDDEWMAMCTYLQ